MTVSNEAPYDIEDRRVIIETPDVLVQILTLGSGKEIPWHIHTAVTDTIACLDGPMAIKFMGNAESKVLWKGETFTVPPNTPHQVAGKDGRACRFLIVQGVGKYDFVSINVPS